MEICNISLNFALKVYFIILMDIPKIISERRKVLGITQTDLAEMAGVGVATVKDLERGKGNPSLKTLERLCVVLGFEIELKIKHIEL